MQGKPFVPPRKSLAQSTGALPKMDVNMGDVSGSDSEETIDMVDLASDQINAWLEKNGPALFTDVVMLWCRSTQKMPLFQKM